MALLDQYGRPVQLQRLTEMQATPSITGIRQAWAGSVASGLTPYRLASILRACDDGDTTDFLILAEEMEERDPHYFSVLGMRKRVVSGLKPRVIAASEAAGDQDLADRVREDIAEHDALPNLVEDMLDALGKGFSVVEIEWDRSGSVWTPERFERVDPRFFQFDRETGREMRLRDMADLVDGLPLDPYKFIRHTAGLKSGLTFRGGLARVVAFSWMCKAYTFKDWMAFIETYGLPLRLGRYGPEATKEDVQKLFQAVANIGTDAAAVLPKSMEIDFENGPASKGEAIFENLARYVDEQISKAVLGQTMTSDNGSSQSQAEVHNEVRHDIAASDARGVTNALNRDLVRPYVDLNFGVQKRYPKLVFEVAEPEDTKLLIDGAALLMAQGLKFKATELRAKLGFSDPEDGDEVVGGTPTATPPPTAANRLALNREGMGGDEIDDIEADMMADWQEVSDDLEAAIASVVGTATSYDDLMTKLPETLSRMPTSKVIDTLVKGMFKARVLGDRQDG